MSPLGWRDWESVGSLAGIRAFADVSACVRANRVEVLANGPSGRCHYTSSDLDGWEKWSDLGGKLIGPPTAVSWGPERLDVFRHLSRQTPLPSLARRPNVASRGCAGAKVGRAACA
jgi:hypothetical protein